MKTSTKRSTDHRGGKGTRKIPLKKMGNDRSLFKKTLSALCGVGFAAIAFSPAGNPFTFGDVDSLLLHNGRSLDHRHPPVEEENETEPSPSSSEQRVIDDDADADAAASCGRGPVGWWHEVAIDGMGSEELKSMLDQMLMYEKMLGGQKMGHGLILDG